jgi:two-component system phosphate regulon sensor histidine kinase PhoR
VNLLDNAIKYTPPGGDVTLSTEQRNGDYLVAVTDSGPGIPLEAQPHIFDRFFRADAARTRSAAGGGAGLGLSIAWRIARAHGGRLELASSSPAGTEFTFTLPAFAAS